MRAARVRARGDTAGVIAASLVPVAVSILYGAALAVSSLQSRDAPCAEACACTGGSP